MTREDFLLTVQVRVTALGGVSTKELMEQASRGADRLVSALTDAPLSSYGMYSHLVNLRRENVAAAVENVSLVPV